jgi:glycosyltransferase involved in cell wall biosynthesis
MASERGISPAEGAAGGDKSRSGCVAFTVFTPAYNRANLLPRVCQSLRQQTFTDFEWLIVDDGSTDNTREVVAGFQPVSPRPIRYLWKQNGGKHTALNLAVREAKGVLFTVVDSDDWLKPDALERMKHHWDSVPSELRSRFKGVCGLFAYESGHIVGDRFPADPLDSDDLELRYRYRVRGDKIGCMRLEVMREFPFPENLDEQPDGGAGFVSESLVWNRMALMYRTRYINEVFGIKQYQQGGLTDKAKLIKVRNSRASLLVVKELISCGRPLPWKEAIRAYSNYVRRSLEQRIPICKQLSYVPQKALFLACLPIGIWLWRRDRRLANTSI